MLILKMNESTQNGNQKRIGRIYTDKRYSTTFPHQRDKTMMYQFVLDQPVRHASIIKENIENLRTFPHITLDDSTGCLEDVENKEDLTKEYFKHFINALEMYMGKLEYTSKRTDVEKGVIKYFKENGVDVT